jgi:hypothetical protein
MQDRHRPVVSQNIITLNYAGGRMRDACINRGDVNHLGRWERIPRCIKSIVTPRNRNGRGPCRPSNLSGAPGSPESNFVIFA